MPKILITGNGFDLYHKLPTSYEDFITTLKTIEQNSEILENYNDYFKSDPIFDSVIYDKDNIEHIKSLLNNKWYLCFKNEFQIDTWIDFETKLEEVLKVIWYFVKSLNQNYFINKDLPPQKFLSFEEHFDFKLKYILILDYFKIIKIHETNYKYFSCVDDFCKIVQDQYSELDDKKISDFLINEWDQFIEIFDLYINTFVTPLINSPSIKSPISFAGIDYYFTFNYTNVFEKIYGDCKSNYIHGKLSVNNLSNSIVLGFNDVDANITNKKFYIPFTKFFQKLQKETDFKFLSDVVTNYDSYNHYIFYFFGHSLDISDVEYINDVFDVLRKDERSLVKIFYRSKNSKDKLLLNLTNILGRDEMTKYMKRDQIEFLYMEEDKLNLELNIPMPPPEIFV